MKILKQQVNKDYHKYAEWQFAWALKILDWIACLYLSIQASRKWQWIPGSNNGWPS